MSNLDTPYSRAILPNNDHPTIELNSKSISTILTTRQHQLDAVLHDISGLEMAMDDIDILHQQLVERTEKIIESMTFHKGLGSALWRLPPEILSLIFHHCLPQNECPQPRATHKAPVLLTRICRPWRDVAVNTPSLWCKLHVEINLGKVENMEFDDDNDDYDDYDWKEEDVEADDRGKAWQQAAFFHDSWLKRSRGCPLSLVLLRYPSTKLLGSLLQPYMHQISSLSIAFPRGAKQPQLLLEGLSTLRELVITLRVLVKPAVERFNISDLTQSIPQLPSTMRVLDVMQVRFDVHHVSSLNPISAHLTHVKITPRNADALLQLLRLCPNLTSLTMKADLSDNEKTLEPVTHANIQSFRVGMVPVMSRSLLRLADLFDALSLPNLRIFEGNCACPGAWPHKQLRDLFARSKCPLESLVFTSWAKAEAVPQAEYLALVPSLNIVMSSKYLFY
ncbi:hypothetical protein P692DRAFT_20720638 [Suillus brevipes Sb2]|nr:hypothetical protein P692DRAFT_20720638 [Suillus brevipes Sb2]